MTAIFETWTGPADARSRLPEWEWESRPGGAPPVVQDRTPPAPQEWEAQEWEAQEWKQPGLQEWENQEWEAQEWKQPGLQEWENQEWEWEQPAQQEWEAQEWEQPELQEWESYETADQFSGRSFKRFARGVGGLARRVAPMAVRTLASMIPGVGPTAGAVLGQLTQRVLREGELAAAELEAEAFGGSQGEAEVGSSETAHEAALTEVLAAEAAAAETEAEAASTVATTLPLTVNIMRGRGKLRPVMPVLTRAKARLTSTIRNAGPEGSELLRVLPALERLAIGYLLAASRAGMRVDGRLAVRAMAAAARRILSDPRWVERAVRRNVIVRGRTAPPPTLGGRRATRTRPRRR